MGTGGSAQGEQMRKPLTEIHARVVGTREPAVSYELDSFQDDLPRRECARENKNGILGRTPGHIEAGFADACRIAIGASRRLICCQSVDLKVPEPNRRLTLSSSQISNSELAQFAAPALTTRSRRRASGRRRGFPSVARRSVPSSANRGGLTLRSPPSFLHQHTSAVCRTSAVRRQAGRKKIARG